MRWLISAGPTREFLDPVRYLSNPSSGRMGIELARAAGSLGHDVVLVHGPCSVRIPRSPRVHSVGVTTCLEMRDEILKAFKQSDIVVMAAAVTDFRAKRPRRRKVKKRARGVLTLKLARNPDILAELARRKTTQILVGFSAETHGLTRYAREKLRRKNLDFVVANRVGGRDSAFASHDNEVELLTRKGKTLRFGRMSKKSLAKKLIRTFLRPS